MSHQPHDSACECCREKTEANIRQYGVSIIGTTTDTPNGEVSMSYTIGLSDAGKSEILVFGLPHEAAVMFLNDAAKRLRKDTLPLDVPVHDLGNFPMVFREVPAAMAVDYIIQANHRAGRDVSVIQMVWPDPHGRFPWEPGFEERFVRMQPPLYQLAN